MNTVRVFVVIGLVLTMVLGVAVLPATAENVTWEGGPGDKWNIGSNWSTGNVPTSSDHAIIKNGNWCKIKANYQAFAQKITIGDGTYDDEVRMFLRSTLTLGDGTQQRSSIGDGGLLQLGTGTEFATLKISGEHTITGEGGTITLVVGNLAINEADDADDNLTIAGSCAANPLSRGCFLVVNGRGSIGVGLLNNAYVVADDSSGFLRLWVRDKDSGSDGFWIAEGGGELRITKPVAGSGDWYTQNEDDPDGGGGKIRIGEENTSVCMGVSGDVFVTGAGAELVAGSNFSSSFCTTGSLTWKSLATGGDETEPMIDATGGVAQFGRSTTCPACQ